MTTRLDLLEGLDSLLDGTPLSAERVKAAWPGLTTREKAYLFSTLTGPGGALSKSQHLNEIVGLALDDQNAFVRYLAAKFVYPTSKDEESTGRDLYEKVQADNCDLVRYANDEHGIMKHLQYKPDRFWEMPQAWRLAKVTEVEGEGEEAAKLFLHAAEHLIPYGKLAEEEVADVAEQYLTWRSVKKRLDDVTSYATETGDGYADYRAGVDLNALWEIVPKLPPKIAYIFLRNLPEDGGLSGGISAQVINGLEDRYLKVLLDRDDISLESVRLEKYENGEESIRSAALSSSNFQLPDSVISALVFVPNESIEEAQNKFKSMLWLANHYVGATMAHSRAISSLIRDAPKEAGEISMFHDHFAESILAGRVKKLSKKQVEREFRDLQILHLAWHWTPLLGEMSESCPAPVRSVMVSGNPWESYLAIKKAMSGHSRVGSFTAEVRAHFPDWNLGLEIPPELYQVDQETVAEADRSESAKPNDAIPQAVLELYRQVGFLKWMSWAILIAVVYLAFLKR